MKIERDALDERARILEHREADAFWQCLKLSLEDVIAEGQKEVNDLSCTGEALFRKRVELNMLMGLQDGDLLATFVQRLKTAIEVRANHVEEIRKEVNAL